MRGVKSPINSFLKGAKALEKQSSNIAQTASSTPIKPGLHTPTSNSNTQNTLSNNNNQHHQSINNELKNPISLKEQNQTIKPGLYTPWSFFTKKKIEYSLEKTQSEPPNPISNTSASLEQQYGIDTDGSIMEVNSNIPIPPPPPIIASTTTEVSTATIYSTDQLKHQLEHAVAERKDRETEIESKLTILDTEINKKLLNAAELEKKFLALAERGLLDLEETKAKSKFYNYWVKEHTAGSIEISISNEPKFNIGLLKIIEIESTIILSGQQEHPIILCTSLEDKMIVWGYLTSQDDQKNTHILTNYQPFSEKQKTQYVRLIKPFVAMTKDVETLPEDQLDKVKSYLESSEVSQKLTRIFQEIIKPSLKQQLMLYDGVGITKEDIEKVLFDYDKQQDKKVEKYFKEYKNLINQGKSTETIGKWLNNIKQTSEKMHDKLQKLIDNHNEITSK